MGVFYDDEDSAIWEPEEMEKKENYTNIIRKKSLSYCPSLLISIAERNSIVPDLIRISETIDDENSKYTLNTFNLFDELLELMDDDNGVKFLDFITINHDFVLSFPVTKLFTLLCSRVPSPKCVKVLLESFADHVNVDQYSTWRVQTPLLDAAKHLCPPLVQTLLDFGADVHRPYDSRITPLAYAICTLRSLYFRGKEENITDIFFKLSGPNLKEAVGTIRLLASASHTDLQNMLRPIFIFDSVHLTLLLIIALPLLLRPLTDTWSIDNTPISKFLTSILPVKEKFINDDAEIDRVWTAVTSVWEASQYICKMHFNNELIAFSGVEEPFPEVMRDFYKQYVDAHSSEAHIASKRVRNEPV